MINETFLPLEAKRSQIILKNILEYLPEIFISEKIASTNDDAKYIYQVSLRIIDTSNRAKWLVKEEMEKNGLV